MGEKLALTVFALCCEDSETLTQYNDALSWRGTHELVDLIPKCISVWKLQPAYYNFI